MPERLSRKLDVVKAIGRGRELARTPLTTSHAELDTLVERKLRRLAEHARTHSPYYARAFADVDLDSPGLLERLPTMDKATLVANHREILTDPRLRDIDLEAHVDALDGDELLLGEYRVLASGGTTGVRSIYVYDRAAWVEVMAGMAFAAMSLGFGPKLPRHRLATIWAAGPAHMTARLTASFRTPTFKRLTLTALAPIPTLVEELNRFQPDWLTAYPTIASLLAEEQLAGRLQIGPRVVMTTSEQCTAAMRRRIEAAWGVPPHDAYASTEVGGIGLECDAHDGLHLNEDHVILEVVDDEGAPVPAGSPGSRVLVTNLFNLTQPMIRFELTDIVSIAPGECTCGRSTRRLVAVDGRSDDIMRLPGATGVVPVHPNHFAEAVESVAAVRAYQVVQVPGGVDIALVATEDVGGEVTSRVAASLAALGVVDVRIHAHLEPAIERPVGTSAKFKLVKALA